MLDDSPQVTTDAPGSAAPAAPAGAPAAADAPAAPRGTQQAIEDARQRLQDGKPLTPGTETDGEAGASAEQAGGEAEDTTAAGDKPGGEAPTGEQAAAEGEQAAGEEEAKFTVTLPGMEERGEKPIELEAPDEETFNRLNRLQNEATIGRGVKQAQREIQRSQGELRELEDKIGIDPSGFVLEQMQEGDRTEIAMQLFFEPAVLDAIQAKLKAAGVEGGIADVLESPDALRTLRAELKASRLEMRDRLRQSNDQRRAMQANAERAMQEIERLIPESVTGEQRELLFRDAIRDVKERVQRLGLTQIDPEDVQLLVSARFRQMGISPAAAGNGGSQPKPGAPGQPAAPAGRTAEQLKQAREARRAAAAPAPAGVGAPAAKPRPDLPKTTEERIKLARKVGLRSLLGRS